MKKQKENIAFIWSTRILPKVSSWPIQKFKDFSLDYAIFNKERK